MKKLVGILLGTGLLMTSQLHSQPPEKIILNRINEPSQQAFTILKPQTWLTEGGIQFWDPTTSGGAGNSIESKIDFALKSDQKGTVKIHWLPDIYFADTRGTQAAALFPVGSNYNGMPVVYKKDASSFLKENVFPYLHPQIQPATAEAKRLPEVEKLCYDTDMLRELGCQYSASVAEFTYSDDGIRYKEIAFCILQDMGPLSMGMWKNRNTVVVRAPVEHFDLWEPLFHEIGQSVVLNPKWVRAELIGQMNRGSTLVKTMQDVARISEEIQKGHARTNSEINEQAYLNLTGQEDYVNPHTGQSERGTNEWDHRWVDDLGNVIYTDLEDYNPNLDLDLHMQGFKRSQVKKK